MTKDIKNNGLSQLIELEGANPIQPDLFHVERQIEIDGVEMGVLENGVPYLTGRGLERMCGLGHGPFHRLTSNWQEEKHKPRGQEIQNLLDSYNYQEDELFIRAEMNGREVTAFSEPVVMSLIEYYAYVADEKRDQAAHAFRTLARTKFREFVYQAVGYNPEQRMLDSWRHFHDRIDMTTDKVPDGYFCVFREIASMIVPMIRSGVMVSDKVIPDISVGRFWSEFWDENGLSRTYGNRKKFNHEYPDYYPQSKSNPQPSHAYPDGALGIFRAWLKRHYISTKLPKYLLGQTKKGLDLKDANLVLSAFNAQQLPPPRKRLKK
ncbi:Uncharacterised protein [Yersinia intermedia]|uniref:hypothetical protein n=1 Tax=Yersinia intermedia TaxID=631 RepID=UPI0005E07876|nr:hypothetical protein [Yersinia intermedia]CNI87663.1 Uncharacterised protein [Yersinia intermedia]